MLASFDAFCERLEHLRLDRSNGVVKPYKPVLLAAVVILIHKGKQSTPHVFLDGGLKSAFHQLLDLLFPRWPHDANARYPFRALENDGVWSLVPLEGASEALRAARDAHEETWDVLRHVRCARLDPEVFERLVSSFDDRFRVLHLLRQRYFPIETSGQMWNLLGPDRPAVLPASSPDHESITERALEEHLQEHWAGTPFAQRGVRLASRAEDGLPGRQVLTPVNAIDLLGYESSAKRWWVFELKHGRPADAVVGQVSRYLGWLTDERKGRGESAVGAIIVREAEPKLKYAVRANERLSLWAFDERLELRQLC